MKLNINRITVSLIAIVMLFSCNSNNKKETKLQNSESKTTKIESIKEFDIKVGQVLVATPEKEDPRFKKTVILVLIHKNEEVVGLILNGETLGTLSESIEKLSPSNLPVKYGGPVGGDGLVFLHSLEDKAKESTKILNGIYFNGDISEFKEGLIENKFSNKEMKFFKGMAGWTTSQLKKEVEIWKGWKIMDVDSEVLMNSSDNLWEELYNQ